jgi:UDP-N-acetylmuramoyl-L-alanyl-D-glutamate--2,6-diaminopimelate ligase
MMMQRLISGLPVSGETPAGLDITGIAYDSRVARSGDLFVAWRGDRFDGAAFAPAAVENGAVAVLAASPGEIAGVPWLTAEDPRRLMSPLAARLYGHPDRELRVVGVTGTNGKSTTIALLAAILEEAGEPTGRLGTLGYHFADRTFPGERTTPEAVDLFRTLRRMRDLGAEAICMEVSSHALAQGRVDDLGLVAALFTNLTRDHFDFHGDFDHYFASKRRIFDLLRPGGRAVVNLDDPWGARLVAELDAPLTFGEAGDVRPLELDLTMSGIRAVIATPRGTFAISSPLVGRYNAENLLAAVAGAEALEVPHPAVAEAVAGCGPIEGRLEAVGDGEPFPIYIDFAHTPAALDAALRSVREFTGRRVIVLFGCGGDRDPGKRVEMGRVAGELADRSILTSDNPRTEDPLEIIAEVERGLAESGNRNYEVVPDRPKAIRRAVAEADERSVVVLAGKGHEDYQIIGDRLLPQSDRHEALAALEERFGSSNAR